MQTRRWRTGAAAVALTLGIAFPPAAPAQEETLFDRHVDHGGFGGPVVRFTEIDDEFAVLVGGRGGWIIDHGVSIGLGGYGLANQDNFDDYVDAWGNLRVLEMGYGGLELEFMHRPNKLVHVSVQALVGAGGVNWGERYRFDFQPDLDPDAFFIVEPGVNVILNVTPFFRIGLGGSYRFVEDVDLPELTEDDLRGAAGLITFKFGKF